MSHKHSFSAVIIFIIIFGLSLVVLALLGYEINFRFSIPSGNVYRDINVGEEIEKCRHLVVGITTLSVDIGLTILVVMFLLKVKMTRKRLFNGIIAFVIATGLTVVVLNLLPGLTSRFSVTYGYSDIVTEERSTNTAIRELFNCLGLLVYSIILSANVILTPVIAVLLEWRGAFSLIRRTD